MEEVTGNEFVLALSTGYLKGRDLVQNRSYGNEELLFDKMLVVQYVAVAGIVCPFKVRLKDVEFTYGLIIGSSTFEKKFIIDGAVFSQSFSTFGKEGIVGDIKGEAIFLDEFIISSGTFKRGVDIYGGTFNNLIITGGLFQASFDGHYIIARSFYIQGGHFKKAVGILGGKFEANFNVNGGYYAEGLYIDSGEFYNSIFISSGQINKPLSLKASKVDYIIQRNEHQRQYIECLIVSETIKSLSINGNQTNRKVLIKELRFNSSPANVNVRGQCIIGKVHFSGYDSLALSTISFSQVILQSIHMDNFNNFGRITFNNIIGRKNKGKIELRNSNVGTVDFIACDFSHFNFVISNSKLVNIFYTSTKFPRYFSTGSIGVEKDRQLRDTYDQLNAVAAKQGDRISALEWQKSSFDSYFHSLKLGGGKWIIVFLMKISNNYRMSSSRAVLFTMIAGLVLFSLFAYSASEKLSLGIPNMEDARALIEATIHYFGYFFEYLNPTHKADFIRNVKSPGWASFFDNLGRLVIGFGIYQTIQAFRRFGKAE